MSTLKDTFQGKLRLSESRDPAWPDLRRTFLKQYPYCQVCSSETKLEVHHVVPVHVQRDLELKWSNLITLCESKRNGVNCHLWFGHLGNFRSWNPAVNDDTTAWREKLSKRSVVDPFP